MIWYYIILNIRIFDGINMYKSWFQFPQVSPLKQTIFDLLLYSDIPKEIPVTACPFSRHSRRL